MGLQILQEANLLFQFVESLATHGLLASMGRIQRIAVQSQARMVGGVEALQLVACHSFAPSRVPNCSKRPAHRRTVDGSGVREASATSGTDRSQLLSDWCNNSHASCRQWGAARAGPRSPRRGLVFHFWQCDKENQRLA